MRETNLLIKKVLQLAREMIILADEGQASAVDDGCRLLCAVVQDSAYKIRLAAERELASHRQSGTGEDDHS